MLHELMGINEGRELLLQSDPLFSAGICAITIGFMGCISKSGEPVISQWDLVLRSAGSSDL